MTSSHFCKRRGLESMHMTFKGPSNNTGSHPGLIISKGRTGAGPSFPAARPWVWPGAFSYLLTNSSPSRVVLRVAGQPQPVPPASAPASRDLRTART